MWNPARSPQGFLSPSRRPPSPMSPVANQPRPPPPQPGFFPASPPPPGFQPRNPMLAAQPPSRDYRPASVHQNHGYAFVGPPPQLKRASMVEQPVVKKPKKGNDNGLQAKSIATPKTPQLSVETPSTAIPHPPKSPPPPVPPPPSSPPPPESPEPSSQPQPADLAANEPKDHVQSSTESTPVPITPIPTSQLSPSAGTATASPPKLGDVAPARPESTEQQGHLQSSTELSPTSQSPVPASPPLLSLGPASSPQLSASPLLLDKQAPTTSESTKRKDQGANFEDSENASPLLTWFATFNSAKDDDHPENTRDILRDIEAEDDDNPENTLDMVVVPFPPPGSSQEAPLEIPSSPEDTKPDISMLSRLKLPSKSPKLKPSKLSEERINIVASVVSNLVYELTQTSDVNDMINLANGAFTYLDSLAIDYLPLCKAVRLFISYNSDKEDLEIQKKGPAFITRTRHHEIVVRLCDAEVAQSKAHTKVKNIEENLAPLRARVEEIRELLRKAEEELSEGEAELADAEVEKALCEGVYSKAEAAVIEITPEMDRAEVIIDDVERRWNLAIDGIERTRNELLLLRK